jgi:hypothetical protein
MMSLTGRPLVAAMCLGQLENLLLHVTVPAIMARSLMPLWGLSPNGRRGPKTFSKDAKGYGGKAAQG